MTRFREYESYFLWEYYLRVSRLYSMKVSGTTNVNLYCRIKGILIPSVYEAIHIRRPH